MGIRKHFEEMKDEKEAMKLSDFSFEEKEKEDMLFDPERLESLSSRKGDGRLGEMRDISDRALDIDFLICYKKHLNWETIIVFYCFRVISILYKKLYSAITHLALSE